MFNSEINQINSANAHLSSVNIRRSRVRLPTSSKFVFKNHVFGSDSQEIFTLIEFLRYVDDCTVSDVADASLKVDVIKNQCFASVINAINTSPGMQSGSRFRYIKFFLLII